MSTLGKGVNPITNSDLYSRTDHFVCAATGHQQSNRGGGSSGAATYWEVRGAKMIDQAREQVRVDSSSNLWFMGGRERIYSRVVFFTSMDRLGRRCRIYNYSI
jgi:hypothetical protein